MLATIFHFFFRASTDIVSAPPPPTIRISRIIERHSDEKNSAASSDCERNSRRAIARESYPRPYRARVHFSQWRKKPTETRVFIARTGNRNAATDERCDLCALLINKLAHATRYYYDHYSAGVRTTSVMSERTRMMGKKDFYDQTRMYS